MRTLPSPNSYGPRFTAPDQASLLSHPPTTAAPTDHTSLPRRSDKAAKRKARREKNRPERPISLPEIHERASPEPREMPARAATSMGQHDEQAGGLREQPRMSGNMNRRFQKAEVRSADVPRSPSLASVAAPRASPQLPPLPSRG